MKKSIILLLVAAMGLSGMTASAETGEMPDRTVNGVDYYIASTYSIEPRFTVLTECSNGLTDMGNGKLKCVVGTIVRNGYTAVTIVELQQLINVEWSTIMTWSGQGGSNASLEEYRYVDSGAYQVKVSHIAMSGSSSVETFTSYSKTVII